MFGGLQVPLRVRILGPHKRVITRPVKFWIIAPGQNYEKYRHARRVPEAQFIWNTPTGNRAECARNFQGVFVSRIVFRLHFTFKFTEPYHSLHGLSLGLRQAADVTG